ncbi:phosphopantetheine-binding protein [Spongisporangium articulatum]|uniref:Phosphopantetheine-binding protein n=1 Tax=Spongisporangium articulatum TaxID=3362603 RepID=A0ABW8AP34_9ACTN
MTTPLREAALAHAAHWQAMTSEIKAVIIDRLDLPVPPEWLTDDQPLFGRGLELDSIDALELSMAIDQKFHMPVYEDDMSIFGSVGSFLSHLTTNREAAGEDIAAVLGIDLKEPQA